MSDVRINSRSPYYVEANPTEPTQPVIPEPIGDEPPTVVIQVDNDNPYLGDTVTLTAIADDADGSIVAYEWGGFGSGTTESITATNLTLISSQIFMVTVTDNDGNTATALATVNWRERPEVTENQDTLVYCGDIINEASFVGNKTYNLVGVGEKIGDVEIEFLDTGNNQDSPVKFEITWNGNTETTGFIGDSEFPTSDPIPAPNNTTSPTNKKQPTTLVINKTAATPTEVLLTALPLFPNDNYSFRLNCPDVSVPETFFYTLTSTCEGGSTTFTYLDVDGVPQEITLEDQQSSTVSAQTGTVSEAVCTGTIDAGGQSFDKGLPEQEFDELTEINIIFDDSGSMDGTLQPLKQMADGTLKDALFSYYNNDEVEYNKRVRVMTSLEVIRERNINVGSIYKSSNRERFLKIFSSLQKRNSDSTKVLNLYFNDETLDAYMSSNIGESYSNASQYYIDDLAEYRAFLSNIANSGSFGTNLSTLVKVDWDYWKEEWVIANDNFLNNIYNGSNGFSGIKGLSDRSEASIFTGVQDGVKYSSKPDYYSDILLQILRNYGYNI